jgi:bis(5'-nucleosyl)-tetraphosphatase (symmetrical)
MATYVVGDIHGCFSTFERLLRRIDYQDGADQIWFVGDLVNRGPDSLSVVRWAARHDAVCVLGNHDLSCLAAYCGAHRDSDDTLETLLTAPDVVPLMEWLRTRPLMHWNEQSVLVHAGFHPHWTFDEACRRARAVENGLRGPNWQGFIREVSDRSVAPTAVSEAIGCFTRIRMCRGDGSVDFGFKGVPEQAPSDLRPWYQLSPIIGGQRRVYFGHWAAHGHRVYPGFVALDAGCVWGGHLVAIRLDDGHVEMVAANEADANMTVF